MGRAPSPGNRGTVSGEGDGISGRDGGARKVPTPLSRLRIRDPADHPRRKRNQLLPSLPDWRQAARGSGAFETSQGRLAANNRRAGGEDYPRPRNRTLNAVPRGALSSTQMRPPCASAASLQNTRPSPRLLRARLLALSSS